MNLADTHAFAQDPRARRATRWVVRIVSPVSSEYREMPGEARPRLMLGGFIPADMLDGATVYVHGAVNPLLQGAREVVAHPDHVKLANARRERMRDQQTEAAGRPARSSRAASAHGVHGAADPQSASRGNGTAGTRNTTPPAHPDQQILC